MKSSLIATSLLAACAAAIPTKLAPRQATNSTNIDPTILQFALTLEHLENAFYKGALAQFTLEDFKKAGYSATYYNNLKYISFDEQSHVQLLTSALQAAGVTPVAPCAYNFPYTDVRSFITLSSVLEGVGTSAYLAGAPLITDKGYLTVAGSILVTESLHTSYQRAAVGEVPMANPYGTPLDPTAVFTLAGSFITSCPSGNAPLPFVPFPALAYNPTASCTCEGPDCSPDAAIKRRSDSWGAWHAPEGQFGDNENESSSDCSGSSSDDDSYSGSDEGYENGAEATVTQSGETIVLTKTETVSGEVVTKTEAAVIIIKTESPEKYVTETSVVTKTVDHGLATVTDVVTKTQPAKLTTVTEPVTKTVEELTTVTEAVTKTEGGKVTVVTEAVTKTVKESGSKTTGTAEYTKSAKPTQTPGSYCSPPTAGASIVLTASGPIPAGSYVTFISGLDVVSVQGAIEGDNITVVIPAVASGQTYALITSKDNEKTLDDTSVLFGPAIVEVAPAAPAV